MSKWSSAFRDSRWQQKRLEVMKRDEWTCRSCGASGEGVTLNVHHAYYESGKAPWEYPSNTLITWCETCHEKRHEMAKYINKVAVIMPIDAYTGLFQAVAIMGFSELFATLAPSPDIDEDALVFCIKALITQGSHSGDNGGES